MVSLHLGWGAPLRRDCAEWSEAEATAGAHELRGTNGLRHERSRVTLPGAEFARAREELLAFRWFPQRFIRAAACEDGATVLQRCRIGPLTVDAPVRVVECADEPRRVALVVVTLRGHPERGVERYELVHDAALDRATLTVEKAWALDDPLARAARPFAAWLQAYATRVSLRRFRDQAW